MVKRGRKACENGALMEKPPPQAEPPEKVEERRAPPAPPSAPPSIVDGEDHHVDPRSVTVERLVGAAVTFAVSVPSIVGISMGWAFGGIPGWLYAWLLAGWAVLFAGIGLLLYAWPAIHYRHLTYRVDETGLRIRSGVVWRRIASVPTTRVQHTDVAQGPLQRRFELATFIVYTAGTQNASIELAGLEHGVANRLRDHLLPEDSDDAV